MTFGYTDPYQQAREARRQVQPQPYPALPQAAYPVAQGPYPLPGFPVPQEPPGGPLAGHGDSIQQVLYGAQPQGPRRRSEIEAMAQGAAIGIAATIVWRRMRARKQRAGEWTTPTFRSQLLWWALFAIVVYLQAVTDSWAVLIGGFALVSLIATAYLTYASRKVARQGRR